MKSLVSESKAGQGSPQALFLAKPGRKNSQAVPNCNNCSQLIQMLNFLCPYCKVLGSAILLTMVQLMKSSASEPGVNLSCTILFEYEMANNFFPRMK